MLTNTTVSKLYLSIIDDVIESMRELYSEEELEGRVLDNLRHLWESKMIQSKAMHDPRQDNPSNFVLQLPSGYSQTTATASAPVVIPAGQHIRSYPVKSNSTTLATFSLPAGLNCPVQIPAGVTLQTASGQLYKVNVPVVVTQAPAGQQPFTQTQVKVTQWKQASGPQSAKGPLVVNMMQSQGVAKTSVPIKFTPQLSAQATFSPQQPQSAVARGPRPQTLPSVQAAVSLEGNEPRPQPLTMGMAMASSSANNLVDFDVKTGEALEPVAQFMASEIEIPQEVITSGDEDEARTAGNAVPPKTNERAMNYVYDLSDIIQLDGPADDSDIEEEGVPLGENDFLRMINAEAINVDESGDGSSVSSSSDGADELDDFKEEEDPLNSGDDVHEQDIPDLFDTDNVIVCQYDKIHRSKNRWKFHFKDGIMCYGGRDYVFSKAVGEAEW